MHRSVLWQSLVWNDHVFRLHLYIPWPLIALKSSWPAVTAVTLVFGTCRSVKQDCWAVSCLHQLVSWTAERCPLFADRSPLTAQQLLNYHLANPKCPRITAGSEDQTCTTLARNLVCLIFVWHALVKTTLTGVATWLTRGHILVEGGSLCCHEPANNLFMCGSRIKMQSKVLQRCTVRS